MNFPDFEKLEDESDSSEPWDRKTRSTPLSRDSSNAIVKDERARSKAAKYLQTMPDAESSFSVTEPYPEEPPRTLQN